MDEQKQLQAVNDVVLCNIRSSIDWLLRLPKSRENSLAITKLEEALMWFEKGMVEK